MDLSLTKPQLMIQKNMRKFATEVLEEWANVLDRESKPLPNEIVVRWGDSTYGNPGAGRTRGAGLDSVSYAIVIEELSRVSGSIGLGVSVHNSSALLLFLNSEPRNRSSATRRTLPAGEK